MCNTYLVLAYCLLWCIFALYAWTVQRRQQRLEKELAELKNPSRGEDTHGSADS